TIQRVAIRIRDRTKDVQSRQNAGGSDPEYGASTLEWSVDPQTAHRGCPIKVTIGAFEQRGFRRGAISASRKFMDQIQCPISRDSEDGPPSARTTESSCSI